MTKLLNKNIQYEKFRLQQKRQFYQMSLFYCHSVFQSINVPLECKVCLETYEEANRRPRTLPCGHTFCSTCINNMLKDGMVSCPTCRTDHNTTDATNFPINYLVEELIASITTAVNFPPANTIVTPHQSSSGCFFKELELLVQGQKDVMANVDLLYQDTQLQLKMYEAQLDDWLEDHEKISTELVALFERLVHQNTMTINLLQAEKSRLQDLKADSEARNTERQRVRHCLASVSTSLEAVNAVDEADANNSTINTWIYDCQQRFPDVNTVHCSKQVGGVICKIYFEKWHKTMVILYKMANTRNCL